jgi:flagellar protein FliT
MSEHNNTDTMLGLYEEVARLTGNMLSAAHQSDWDRLVELEAGCADCIESLKGCQVPEALSESARQQKVEMLKTILANDREIRKLTQPWMQRIGRLLETSQRQCDVARTYRGD